MEVWVDAQLPPSLAASLRRMFAVEARHVLELGLTNARDREIFEAAKSANAVLITKDSDFVKLLEVHGPPPRVLWLTIGNVSNPELWRILETNWHRVVSHFEAGEPLVEIGRAP